MAVCISPRAEVDPRAEIGDEVYIGPFSYVGPRVRIGRGCRIENNVTLTGHLALGEFNHVHPNAVLGGPPQDLTYRGSDTRVVVGDHNVFREGVTVNCGTEKEIGETRIGSHCFCMAGSHIAHDCIVGDRVVLANGVLLGGHVHVHDFASLSGGVAVHHFASIGSYSFVSGLSRVLQDVPPYMLADGVPARPRCINAVALKRNHFSQQAIDGLATAHRLIYRSKVGVVHARDILNTDGHLDDHVTMLLEFIERQQLGRHGRARDGRKAA